MKKADPESGRFHSCGAFLVVVRHVVDPGANWIAAHQPSIAGLQQFRRRNSIPHARKLCRFRLRALYLALGLKPIVQIVTVGPSALLVKFVGAFLNLLLNRD
jgi:hypothetical protein